MCKQIMSELPLERTEPAAPFDFTMLDLFGPHRIRDTMKRTTTMKVWGVVFSCLASRAVYADIVENLSMEAFLKMYHHFTGCIHESSGQKGTNFVGASERDLD